MPRYHASKHAIDRLLERFPELTSVAGTVLTAAKWLGRATTKATVAAQQSGMDLMLCLDLPLISGPVRIYLPVTPQGHDDIWVIRTVLTEKQATANIGASQQAWRERCAASWLMRKHGRKVA